MGFAFGFVAGGIFVCVALWLGIRTARAAVIEEHRLKVEHNRRTYAALELPMQNGHEAESERKAA